MTTKIKPSTKPSVSVLARRWDIGVTGGGIEAIDVVLTRPGWDPKLDYHWCLPGTFILRDPEGNVLAETDEVGTLRIWACPGDDTSRLADALRLAAAKLDTLNLGPSALPNAPRYA